MGGFLESPATTVSEFTPGPVVDLLTHQRLFSAQLQVSTASTCSYDKIQYFKINLFFFFYSLISKEFTHTPCEQLSCSLLASQGASTRNANLHKGKSQEYFCLSAIPYMLLLFYVQLHMTGSDKRMTPSQYYGH